MQRLKWTVQALEDHLSSLVQTLTNCKAAGTTLTVKLCGLTLRVAPILDRIIQERYNCYYTLEEFRGDILVTFYPKTKRLDQAALRKELGREEVAHSRSREAATQEFTTQGIRRSASERE